LALHPLPVVINKTLMQQTIIIFIESHCLCVSFLKLSVAATCTGFS